MTKGSIYIMKNPAFREENMLKIGRTERTPQQRAKELSTTGLPDSFYVVYEQDVANCVLAEKLIHQKLANYRYNQKREFFILPLYEAISTVQEVIQEQFYKISTIYKGTYVFKKGTTFRWSCQSNAFMFLTRYQHFLDERPDIDDMWWCKPKDHILITNRISDDPEQLMEFASETKINGSLSDIINIYPGDRLAIIEPTYNGLGFSQGARFDEDGSAISIIDFREYARMVAFMEEVDLHPGGFLIPFGTPAHAEVSQADARKALNQILNMGSPNVYPDYEYVQSLKSGIDYYI
ncbi:helicase A859L [Crinalium epipsammum PCC 9333]|uniref:Helicase A859L n=1 Tax=Crinalium epipsammum PCC 9333 TaxID=1173022 RepID=K9VZS7_9CYAN|nr:GIY-YIG nuclease family protein [Crinalium epipsammum]AFZ13486.1 helicase A859L [Crinalium epipsammum PCC 9333]